MSEDLIRRQSDVTDTNVEDIIRRQDAIDALYGIRVVGGRNSAVRMMKYIEAVRDRLKQLPSAQPTINAVEVHGHWTNLSISVSGHSSAECSVCGCVVHDSFSNVINYCPNCGAKMDGEVKNDG